jgi:hypothetical protein
VISFTPRPLYPQYPLDRRLGGPQSRSGQRGEEKLLDPTRTRTPIPRLFLYRIRYPGERMEVRKQCSFLSSTYLSFKGIMHHNIRLPQITNAVTVFLDLMQLLRKALEFACVRAITLFAELKQPTHASRIIYRMIQ